MSAIVLVCIGIQKSTNTVSQIYKSIYRLFSLCQVTRFSSANLLLHLLCAILEHEQRKWELTCRHLFVRFSKIK